MEASPKAHCSEMRATPHNSPAKVVQCEEVDCELLSDDDNDDDEISLSFLLLANPATRAKARPMQRAATHKRVLVGKHNGDTGAKFVKP